MSGCAASKVLCFVRALPELCLLHFLFVIMVLIESSGRELSIGCHIVNFDYFDFIDENLDLEADLTELGTF